MASAPKTLRELSKVLEQNFFTGKDVGAYINNISPKAFEEALKNVKKLYKTEKDRLDVYKTLFKYANEYSSTQNEIYKIIEKQLKSSEKVVNQHKAWGKSLEMVSKSFDTIIKQNEEIFKISHEMQLESNVTWKQYRQLYQGAYEAARQMNKEFGQSVVNAKDLVEVQNQLLSSGWKNIRVSDIANLSASVRLMQDTLGKVPIGISTAFQMAYRQFGEETNMFATKLGNQLNAFSNTFGVTVGMLTGAVEKMAANNSFIARSNMQAQMMANESLIKAAALSGAVGLTTTDFLTSLSSTAQFGTMEEMAGIYQGGAMLQGFDTESFRQMLIGQDYEGATMSLFGSISDTLNSINDQYLRAEYMQKIGGAFGLSETDLLQIMTNGENLAQYSADLQEKLQGLDTSMVDEVKDLKVSVMDRLENWWTSTEFSQGFGSTMQELGLVGIVGHLKISNSLLGLIAAKDFGITGKLGGMMSGGATSTGSILSGQGGILAKTAGVGIGVGGNILGSGIINDTSKSNAGALIGGGLLNVGSGVLGGAMVGGIPGAVVGGLIGLGNTIFQGTQRQSAIKEMEDEDRRRRQSEAQAPAQTGNPVVDAINNMNNNITNVITKELSESRNMQFVLDMKKTSSTGGGL